MAKKKRVMRKSPMKPTENSKMSCGCGGYFNQGYGCVKLASMAFILFLITVWPGAMALVHRIHWGWFLGATVLFSLIAVRRVCWCRK